MSPCGVTRPQWVKWRHLVRWLGTIPNAFLTHWGRVTHICVSKLTIIGSDNGLSPGRRQAIICTNVGILLIRTLGTDFSEILGKILSFSFKKMHLKMSSVKGRLFSLGLNGLMKILQISLKCKPDGSFHSKWVIVQVMACPKCLCVNSLQGFDITLT